MNQASAIHTINQLLPEINRTREPDTVLLKYASENNLAPAQLERLGQVFNTAKTISYMEKSASRGGSFMLLDIEDMLGKYMELDAPDTNLEKKASSGIKPAAKPFSIPTIWTEMDKEASTPTKYVDPHWEALKKEAAAQAAAREFRDELEFCEELITLKQVLFDEIHDGLSKIAFQVYEKGPETFAALERDSRSSPHNNENALEYLAQTLDRDFRGAYVREDLTKLASIRVTKDTTGLLSAVTSLEDSIQLYDKTRSLMLEKVATQNPFGALDKLGPLPPGPEDEEEEEPESDEIDATVRKAMEDEAAAQNPPKTQGTRTDRLPDFKMGEPSEEDTTTFDQDIASRDKKTAMADILRRMSLSADSGDWKEEKVEEKPEPKPNLYDKGLAKVDSVVSPIATERVKWLLDSLHKKPTHNTMALTRDNARQDVGRVTSLQQAIMNDDVLSGADPERVASLYNTLYRANPEMMSDPNVMSAALREAVQYDGVMPHTYEQFVGTAKQRAEQETKAMELKDRKYKL